MDGWTPRDVYDVHLACHFVAVCVLSFLSDSGGVEIVLRACGREKNFPLSDVLLL